MFDMTGDAFEKFGNFLRGESTEKKKYPETSPITSDFGLPLKSQREFHDDGRINSQQ